jgi:hypothetical protein
MWPADWPSNQWIGEAGDYGTMKFSLAGGASVIVDHKMTPVERQEGTYFMDVNAMTLTLTGVEPLVFLTHPSTLLDIMRQFALSSGTVWRNVQIAHCIGSFT